MLGEAITSIMSNLLSNELYVYCLDVSEQISKMRPLAHRKYDQIYMKTAAMSYQAIALGKHLKPHTKTIFLGDGDGISVLFAMMIKKMGIEYKQELTVFDFDERILNNYKRISNMYNLEEYLVDCIMYNVIEPIPVEYKGRYDYFYINPPYGSKNDGDSCIAWLHRCMDACKDICAGCIVLPRDINHSWTISNFKNIENFLKMNGFEIEYIDSNVHTYHLEDNPCLRSSSIFVKKNIQNMNLNKYSKELLPINIVKNLYGNPRKIPHYIRDDKSDLGHEDFNWNYGKDNFWRYYASE